MKYKARLEALRGRRLELARTVDQEADRLVTAIGDLLAVADDMYRLAASLGANRPRLRLDSQVAAYLAWRLGPLLPGLGRADRFYRRPLAEILGGTDEGGAAQASGPQA